VSIQSLGTAASTARYDGAMVVMTKACFCVSNNSHVDCDGSDSNGSGDDGSVVLLVVVIAIGLSMIRTI